MPAPALPRRSDRETAAICESFADLMVTRRTIRDFSTEPVSLDAIRHAVRAAATAPSGANVQPWRFVVVTDPELKRQLRLGAEAEEQEFYANPASLQWREALAPLGTDWHKPFLEQAPVIIVVFEVHRSASTPRPYYTKESVGIAVGLLLTALHQAGLATLTHTHHRQCAGSTTRSNARPTNGRSWSSLSGTLPTVLRFLTSRARRWTTFSSSCDHLCQVKVRPVAHTVARRFC